IAPGAREQHLVSDLPDLLAEIEAGRGDLAASFGDRDPVSDRLVLGSEAALEKRPESRPVGERHLSKRTLVLALGGLAGRFHHAVVDPDPALAPEPADPDRGEGVRLQRDHRYPVADLREELALG